MNIKSAVLTLALSMLCDASASLCLPNTCCAQNTLLTSTTSALHATIASVGNGLFRCFPADVDSALKSYSYLDAERFWDWMEQNTTNRSPQKYHRIKSAMLLLNPLKDTRVNATAEVCKSNFNKLFDSINENKWMLEPRARNYGDKYDRYSIEFYRYAGGKLSKLLKNNKYMERL